MTENQEQLLPSQSPYPPPGAYPGTVAAPQGYAQPPPEVPYYQQQGSRDPHEQPLKIRVDDDTNSHASSHASLKITAPQDDAEYAREIKAGFLRKVYGIILYMFGIVGIFSLPAMYGASYRQWLTDNPLMILLWVVLFIACMIGLFCQHRNVPMNYIWCSGAAASMGMILSHVIAVTSPTIVFIAILLTVGMTLVITLSAMATKEPSQGCLRMFLIVLISSLVAMIFMMIFAPIPALHSFFCTLYILIYGMYLWIDTWLIVNEGVHGCDTYMLAAFFVWLDIVMIFLYLLLLLGGGRK